MLSAADREKFHQDGYICIRNFFSPAEVAQLNAISSKLGAEATEVLKTAVAKQVSPAELAAKDPNSLIVVPEASNPLKVCRFEYILAYNAELKRLINAKVLPVLEQLGGEKYLPFKDKENEKHPGGGAFPPHQDFAAYQYFHPKYQITAAVSIDSCTKQNGCLQFSPNWRSVVEQTPGAIERVEHGRPLLHFVKGGPMNGDIRPDVSKRLSWEFVETTPADLVLFDSFAPHQSFKNLSEGSRRVLLLTFSPAKEGDTYATYYADKRKNYNDPKFHVSTPTQHSALSKKAKL